MCYDGEVYVALLNKWLLNTRKDLSDKKVWEIQDYKLNDVQTSTVKHASADSKTNQSYIIRHEILHKMLFNVCHNGPYLKLLKQLHDAENSSLTKFDEYVFLNDII